MCLQQQDCMELEDCYYKNGSVREYHSLKEKKKDWDQREEDQEETQRQPVTIRLHHRR